MSKLARATRDQMSLARLDEDSGDGARAKATALARGVKSNAYTKLMRLAEPVASGRRTILSRIGRINDEAFWQYAPRHLAIDVDFLPATIQPDGATPDLTLGFGPFHSGGQRIQEISGHFSGRFIELDLETTATVINDRMTKP